jgi:hypothetical protein
MATRHSHMDEVRARLAAEVGMIRKDAPERVALVYPSPYSVGMSSLGFQTIYREINDSPGRAAHRAFLPDDVGAARHEGALCTYETGMPVGDYPVVALSVAYELELAGWGSASRWRACHPWPPTAPTHTPWCWRAVRSPFRTRCRWRPSWTPS